MSALRCVAPFAASSGGSDSEEGHTISFRSCRTYDHARLARLDMAGWLAGWLAGWPTQCKGGSRLDHGLTALSCHRHGSPLGVPAVTHTPAAGAVTRRHDSSSSGRGAEDTTRRPLRCHVVGWHRGYHPLGGVVLERRRCACVWGGRGCRGPCACALPQLCSGNYCMTSPLRSEPSASRAPRCKGGESRTAEGLRDHPLALHR